MPDLDPVKTFMETTFLQCVLKVSNMVNICTLFIIYMQCEDLLQGLYETV